MIPLLADTAADQATAASLVPYLLAAIGALAGAVVFLWYAYSKVQDARVTFAIDTSKAASVDAALNAKALADVAEQSRRVAERSDVLLRLLDGATKDLAVLRAAKVGG